MLETVLEALYYGLGELSTPSQHVWLCDMTTLMGSGVKRCVCGGRGADFSFGN